MPCMCGDYCCPSCGPAQGNWRCPICNGWASECCEHIDKRNGNLKKRYVTAAEDAARKEAEAEAKWFKFLEEHEEEINDVIKPYPRGR